MRALVAHQPAGSNPTLLPFSRGEVVSVLVQQPRNGWLYGRADGGARSEPRLPLCEMQVELWAKC